MLESDRREMIRLFVRDNPGKTANEITKRLNLPEHQVKRDLLWLIEAQTIKRELSRHHGGKSSVAEYIYKVQ